MRLSRRNALKAITAALASARRGVSADKAPKFEPTWESLKQYRCPEWFRNAKFGIWAHWGPQGAPMQGDWYARNMYIQGTRQYEYNLKMYGHPSAFGFKDVIPLWAAKYEQAKQSVLNQERMDAWPTKMPLRMAPA